MLARSAAGVTIRVVPVLDVRGGRAVRADGGPRGAYAPIQSVWGPVAGAPAAADPVVVARALRDGRGGRRLYLAHLDAIEEARAAPGGGPCLAAACDLVSTLAEEGLEVWVDAGTGTLETAAAVLEAGAARAIIGLETLKGASDLEAIAKGLDRSRIVFGLDVRSGSVLAAAPELRRLAVGDAAALALKAGFRTILLLDLDRVGRGGGPPLQTFRRLRSALPGVEWAVGGGVRGEADVSALEEAGCAFCLVGSALHDGGLGPQKGWEAPVAAVGSALTSPDGLRPEGDRALLKPSSVQETSVCRQTAI